MGVAFSNNWENILDKLESVVKTEFGATLKTYRGLDNITEGNQYLRIAPVGSELVDYSGNLEIRRFSLNLFLYFKVINAKKTNTDQVMRVLSRLETIIGNNMTMTLSDDTQAYNCRIESTEIDTSNSEEYLINLEYKCLHQNSSLTPSVTITAAEVADGATSSDSGLSLTFTLNRDSDNFVVGDVDVTNGSLSSFSGSGSIYTATFTPSASGATTIKVLADKFTGTGASGGNTASDIFNWTYVPKFIFTVNTGGNSFTLPLVSVAGHTPNFTIDWGDGSPLDITSHDDSDLTKSLDSSDHTITIDGIVKGLKFAGTSASRTYIKTISNWGGLDITEDQTFRGCSSLNVTASNAPAITSTTLNATFLDCTTLTAIGTGWDVSNVTEFNNMFSGCTNFNGSDVVNWDTSSGETMERMFSQADYFNQNIGGWNTSSVTRMDHMFLGADSFNQNIGSWNTGNVTTMKEMFYGAYAFNGAIGNWDVTSVTTMHRMFRSAIAFNQDIGSWDTSNVTNMISMFTDARSFNQNIGSWNVANVTDFTELFRDCTAFDNGGSDDINNWNTGNVTSMYRTFKKATSFNRDISGWDTSSVTSMRYMFSEATVFNKAIPTSGSDWDVSNVTIMGHMFDRALAFDQDLSTWDFSGVTNTSQGFNEFMNGKTSTNKMSTVNYNKLLVRLDVTNSTDNHSLDGGDATATDGGAGGNGATARTNLETDHSWTIVDGDG